MTCPDDPTAPMADRTCLVTGANSGIGYHTALGLADAGARVLVHARREDAGRQAVAQVREATGNDQVELTLADLASLDQVRGLAKDVRARVDQLDVLVNNAGAVLGDRQRTVDGHEQQFQVNHLAPFLLTHELIDPLRAAASDRGGARIVNVASEAHWNVRARPNEFQSLDGRYRSFHVYGQTKLYNILFTRELARRLSGGLVTANCLHPGVIGSRFGNAGPWYVRAFMAVARPLLKGPDRGARTSLYLACRPDLESVTGQYFKKCEAAGPSKLARDHDLAQRLWAYSEELTGATDWPATPVGR